MPTMDAKRTEKTVWQPLCTIMTNTEQGGGQVFAVRQRPEREKSQQCLIRNLELRMQSPEPRQGDSKSEFRLPIADAMPTFCVVAFSFQAFRFVVAFHWTKRCIHATHVNVSPNLLFMGMGSNLQGVSLPESKTNASFAIAHIT